MQLPDAASDSAAMLQRIERLERRNAALAEPEPASEREQAPTLPTPKSDAAPSPKSAPAAKVTVRPPEPAPEAKPEPKPEAAPAEPLTPGEFDAAALRRLWPDVLEVVKESSRRTRALLDNAQIVEVSGDVVTLAAPGALAKMIADDSNTSVLRGALTKVVGGEWKIAVVGAANGTTEASATAQRQPVGPEPDPRDEPDYDPASTSAASPTDPETEAMRLLQDQLDARPLDS
jgi:DNA polymerase-3 subunit gamma/tau